MRDPRFIPRRDKGPEQEGNRSGIYLDDGCSYQWWDRDIGTPHGLACRKKKLIKAAKQNLVPQAAAGAGTLTADLGDGLKQYSIAPKTKATQASRTREILRALRLIDGLLGCVDEDDALHAGSHLDGSPAPCFNYGGADITEVVRDAIVLGRLLERVQVREVEDLVAIGRKTSKARSKSAKKKSLLTEEQWTLVYAFIDREIARREQRGKRRQVTAVCVETAGTLRAGKFPGIRKRVDFEPSTLPRKYRAHKSGRP